MKKLFLLHFYIQQQKRLQPLSNLHIQLSATNVLITWYFKLTDCILECWCCAWWKCIPSGFLLWDYFEWSFAMHRNSSVKTVELLDLSYLWHNELLWEEKVFEYKLSYQVFGHKWNRNARNKIHKRTTIQSIQKKGYCIKNQIEFCFSFPHRQQSRNLIQLKLRCNMLCNLIHSFVLVWPNCLTNFLVEYLLTQYIPLHLSLPQQNIKPYPLL